MLELIFLIPLFACWGSFLNVVAYRLIHEEQFITGRSFCISCKTTLCWYDLIPLISYFNLKGFCRTCKKPISWLYPGIELLTIISLTFLYLSVPYIYFFTYFLFFSALIITIRTDLESMLISRWVTLIAIPLGVFFSYIHAIPINTIQSIIGIMVGYGILWVIKSLFFLITKKHGMGEGDLDLLAFIGSFTGPIGVWSSLLIGSVIGTGISLGYMFFLKKFDREMQIPFGPFLALGAILYVLFPFNIVQSIAE